ncbi:phospholipid-transporting ATPase ABCA3-like [Amblyomma americanum]
MGRRFLPVLLVSATDAKSTPRVPHRDWLAAHLWLHKGPGYKSSGVEAVLRKHHSRAERVEDKPGIVVYRLTGSSDTLSTLMRDLFADLENSKASLGVAKMGVIVTTLEDILEGIHKQRSLLVTRRVPSKRHSFSTLTIKEAVSRLKIDMSALEGRVEHDEPDPVLGGAGTEDALRALRNRTVFVEATSRSRLQSLFHKRVLHWKRMPVQRTLRWLLPTALLLLGGYCESSILSGIPKHDETLSYDVHNIAASAVGFCGAKGGRFQQFMTQRMCPVLEESGVQLETMNLTNIAPQLLALANHDVYSYVFRFQIGAVSSESASRITLWFNGQNPHSALLALNLLHTALLRNMTGHKTAAIRFTNAPDAFQAEETVGVLLSFFREFELGSPRRDSAGYVVHLVLVRVLCAVFVPTALCYHATHFVGVVLSERVSGAKHQQLLTGIGGALFWLGHLLFDGCRGLVHAFAFTAATAAFRPFLGWNFVYAIFTIFLLYTFVAISLAYLFSFWFDNASKAFYTIAGMYLVGGVLGSLFSTATDLFVFSPSERPGLRSLMSLPFRWVPTYLANRGITKLILLRKEHLICSEDGLSLKLYCREDFVPFTQRLEECCPPLKDARSADRLQPFSIGLNTGLYEILSLLLEGGFCFALVNFLDSDLLQRFWSYFSAREPAGSSKAFLETAEDEVAKERQQVEDIYKMHDFEQRALLVRGLSKTYGFIRPRCGIDNVSFCVRQGECLGVVGVLGTGKTTLVSVLGGELFPTSGDAYMGLMSLTLHYRQWLRNVGYVPHAGGFLETLTGREMICLLAALRGVQDVPRVTRCLLRIVDLVEPDAAIASYGVGARFQLSLALALMVFPRLYLLDLPDLDSQTRALVRRVLECLRQYSTVVLTCEHLHLYESVCDRIAILAAGRIECIGSVKELSDKYCHGTTITIYTFPDRKYDLQHQRLIVTETMDHFPTCALVRCYEGILEFRISEPPTSLCETFDRLLFLKRQHKFHFFYVSDTTLDQIFASLGRKHVGLKARD